MKVKRFSKIRLKKAVFGCLFALIGALLIGAPAWATEVTGGGGDATAQVVEQLEDGTITGEDVAAVAEAGTTSTKTNEQSCKESLGAVGWLVCPGTGVIAKAVDWLYDKIEEILVINPAEMKDGAPIYEIWKYMQGIANLGFVIFLIIMVYSQVTGVGINNYGLKKALPKLIVAAILTNLSFVICSLAVDASNLIGGSLRGLFTSIEEATMVTTTVAEGAHVSLSEMYMGMAGGTAVAAAGGAIAFEAGAIWMLIPTVLGAIVAVVVGLITIALRQAVVALLTMVAPLAMVAYILPNTEQWFKKWKDLFTRMLVFYPAFSLLFGAASLAGWAIIASASNGFWLCVGVAVQIFPLFYAWKMMQMSGTVLSSIHARLSAIAAKPVAANRAWAESHREATRQKYLASNNVYTPSLRLRQFLNDRKVAREQVAKIDEGTSLKRGQAYAARSNYRWKKGQVVGASRTGERLYEAQARRTGYDQTILRDQDNFNKGLGEIEAIKTGSAGTMQLARLKRLDIENAKAATQLNIEKARAEKIDYDNAVSFHKAMEEAMNAHFDEINWDKTDEKGKLVYKRHFASQASSEYTSALERYNQASAIMEGNAQNVQYVAAYAAQAYDTQSKVIMTKFQKYFELVPPTKDVMNRLEEFSKFAELDADGKFKVKAVDNIDAIISGLRVVNQRGDTDLVRDIMYDLTDEKYGGLTLGTHASQALASFFMFEVKDSDPYLRRFGKYINLETARVYNENGRKKMEVDYEEYIRGYHDEVNENGEVFRMYAKKGARELMQGTSLDKVERTAYDSFDESLRRTYTDENGVLDVDAYLEKKREIDESCAPQFISANLKYLSGSEQISSAVKSKTGYFAKQNEDGTYDMVAMWEDEKKKRPYGDKVEDVKEWYRRQTVDYIAAQTPAQILGLRSDYHVPLVEHFAETYLRDEKGEYIPDRKNKFDAAVQAINEKYGAGTKDAKDRIAKLKRQNAGEAFRELLYKKGKLSQIEKSKRSGAANNAKDWVREMLLLDSPNGLMTWINKRNEAEKRKGGGSGPDNNGGGSGGDGPVGGDSGPRNGGGPVSGGSRNNDGVGQGGSASGANANQNRDRQSEQRRAMEELERQREQFEKEQKRRSEQREQEKMLEELEKQRQQEADPVVTPVPEIHTYSAEDITGFANDVEKIYDEIRESMDVDDPYEAFYAASCEYLANTLGDNSKILKMYEDWHDNYGDGSTSALFDTLQDLMSDLDNY